MPYSNLDHFLRAVWLNDYCRENLVMLFSAYFDAAGDKRLKVMTCAGGISPVSEWLKFEGEWNTSLRKSGLPDGTVFHMTDFVTRHPPFHIFDSAPKRRALIEALMECIIKHVRHTVSVSLVVDDYQELDQKYCLHEFYGPPYSFVSVMGIGLMQGWIGKSKSHKKHRCEYFFERGDQDQHEFKERCGGIYGFRPNTDKTKAEVVSFQMGDLIGWKNRVVAADALAHGPTGDIDKLDSLLKSLEPIAGRQKRDIMFEKEGLLKVIATVNVPLRGNLGKIDP